MHLLLFKATMNHEHGLFQESLLPLPYNCGKCDTYFDCSFLYIDGRTTLVPLQEVLFSPKLSTDLDEMMGKYKNWIRHHDHVAFGLEVELKIALFALGHGNSMVE